MEKQNITLSIPKDILRKVKIIAAEGGTSISALLSNTLQEIVLKKERYRFAKRRHKAIMERGLNLGAEGEVGWDREELHERG